MPKLLPSNRYYSRLPDVDDPDPALVHPVAEPTVHLLLLGVELSDRFARLDVRACERREVHAECVARADVFVQPQRVLWGGVQAVEELC